MPLSADGPSSGNTIAIGNSSATGSVQDVIPTIATFETTQWVSSFSLSDNVQLPAVYEVTVTKAAGPTKEISCGTTRLPSFTSNIVPNGSDTFFVQVWGADAQVFFVTIQ